MGTPSPPGYTVSQVPVVALSAVRLNTNAPTPPAGTPGTVSASTVTTSPAPSGSPGRVSTTRAGSIGL